MVFDEMLECTWRLAGKLAMSAALLVGLTVHTFRLIHQKELRVNRLSFLPLYCVIGVAFSMNVYYVCHICFQRHISELAEEEGKDQKLYIAYYSMWRQIL